MLIPRIVALALITSLFLIAPAARVTATKLRGESAKHAPGKNYAPGQVIIKLKAIGQDLPGATEDQLLAVARQVAEKSAGPYAQSVESLVSNAETIRAHQTISRQGLDRIFILNFDATEGKDIDSILAALRSDESVEYAEPNYKVTVGTALPNDPRFSEQWGLRNLGVGVDGNASTPNADVQAVEAWEITTGSPDVVIALTDTGVDLTHPDIAENIYVNTREIAGNNIDDDRNGYVDDVQGYNVADRNGDTNDAVGHGTQMAGIIAARSNNSVGISGVSQSKILPVKFFRRTGPNRSDFDATVADAARALIYSIAAGASLINASWRTVLAPGEVPEDHALALRDAVRATADAGILLVCIAGNDGFDNDVSLVYPGAYRLPNQIVVAASDYNDEIWHPVGDPFTIKTGFGPNSVHLTAPGVSIFTTIARGNCFTCTDSDNPADWYGSIDGTSASAAFVSGVAALIKTVHPDEYVTLLKRRIVESVDVYPHLQPFVITSGRLNAARALRIQVSVTPPVLTRLKYKSGSGKLFVYGEQMQSGAVVLVGNTTYPTKVKKKDLSLFTTVVPSSAFPSGIGVDVRLRNPDGGISQPIRITR